MSIGKIAEFNMATDNWRLYVERLEQYFIVNKITNDLKVPTLITVMGADSYELLVNLCTPTKPNAKTFEEITEIMSRHLQPTPNELAERYKFRCRKQMQGESISEYVAVLKKMSKTCEFGASLEENLRDQLVCGISNDTIRQRLFAESKLDFTKAYNLGVSLEAAEKDSAAVEQQLRSGTDSKGVECQAMSTGYRSSIVERRNGRSRADGERGIGPRREAGRTAQGARAPRPAPASGRRLAERGQPQRQCRVCGAAHDESTCRYARYVCRVCNQAGHLRRMCPRLIEHHGVEINNHSDQESDQSDEVTVIEINQVCLADCKPMYMSLEVHGKLLKFEVDTGSVISCINIDVYRRLFSEINIQKCNIVLRYYTGESVRPVGVIRPLVKYKNISQHLDLYVIEKGKTVLLGRQWLASLNIDLPDLRINCVNMSSDSKFNVTEFSSRYAEVFADGLGRFTGGKVSISVREGARPVFLRARPLAYALREPVERALEQLVQDGILTPVERSDWATPIVPVVKKDGNIRICADYKLTLNKVIEIDRYPLPKFEDLITRLNGGEHFTKIDFSQAYAQFELDDSNKYTVINTHKGLFRYNRLVYGLASSPAIFQRHLEQIFADLPNVGIFLDDVIITGPTTKAHIDTLHKVFSRLQQYGLKVKRDKCSFFAKQVVYLGHVISKRGVHTCPDKVEAILKTPEPKNVSELRAFLGLINYYNRFMQNSSTVLAPLYNLLKSKIKYRWSIECKNAFTKIKERLASSEVLVHYSPDLPLIVTTDASAVGVGAVLAHHTPDGERPVAYASRALTPAERAYSQIDREALAIVYAVRKYHQYLYGREFILRTDHKPLTYIFGNKVGIPVMAASRLQRWAILLSGYNYKIEYVTSKGNCADALSRLPHKTGLSPKINENTYVNFVENFLPINSHNVKAATSKDTILSRVMTYTHSGWPGLCPNDEIKPFFSRRRELYIECGCLMWGYRMVIPAQLQPTILKQLHSSHMGIGKTKGLARSYVWWPNIDGDIESMCKQCVTCAAEADAPPRAPPQPWPYTAQPWTRVHVDFLGPFKGKTFFVLIDSSSKWIEIYEMNRTTASSVIKVLREIFARFGLPIELVSDQGPPFTSFEFSEFLKRNGIRQLFSPAYHPASNGAAENAVKLCKRAIKKAYRDKVDVDAALQTFLLAYRNSIHGTTGETPAMLLQRRALRNRLDLLRNQHTLENNVFDRQRRQSGYTDRTPRTLDIGDTVWARNYGSPDKWVEGTVRKAEGSRRYIIDSGDGRFLKRHVDQVRRRSLLSNVTSPNKSPKKKSMNNDNNGVEGVVPQADDHNTDDISKELPLEEDGGINSNENVANPGCSTLPPTTDVAKSVSPRSHYPSRQRKPVVRFAVE
ncbi:hypothetical protein K1T71_012326 [Dendrolimus kikuchii]|uniref:Uncharacterized protein n=1 Tax=Dendrolimus kikuchii TaxID=765133 RepID=A0ACC1CL77_9NEOP|nr:hypothetical protein K1T71_012326 [Dendrolimus kikuchii]